MSDELIKEYERLKRQLDRETAHHSNPAMWLRNENYGAIVALGPPVVPAILADLKTWQRTQKHDDFPGWWAFSALRVLTGCMMPVGGKEARRHGGFIASDIHSTTAWWVKWHESDTLTRERMMALTQEHLDAAATRGCQSPGCTHENHDNVIYLHQRCCPGGRIEASYKAGSGVLHVACFECKKDIALIAVKEADDE